MAEWETLTLAAFRIDQPRTLLGATRAISRRRPRPSGQALGYTAERLNGVSGALTGWDEHDAKTRHAWMELRLAADALHAVLATGTSQRIPVIASSERLPIPAWDGHPRTVALVWRLAKDGARAECQLVTHPLGAEIRVAAAGEHERSEAGAIPWP